ncbi:MAG TPA: hypothetical protein VEF36_15370 [Roseiarcus sp.]|nr:hypothetical protein [Roseiarcus sp.]
MDALEIAKMRGASVDGLLTFGLGPGRAAAIAGLHRLCLPSSQRATGGAGGRADVLSLFSVSEYPGDPSRNISDFHDCADSENQNK